MSLRRVASAALAACLALAACNGRQASTTGAPSAKPPKKGPALAILDLSAGAPEVEASGLFGPPPGRRRSFDALLDTIDDVSTDKDTAAVFIRLGGALGLARAEELSAALGKLRAKHPVFCHSHGYNNATVLVAAQGCTKTWVSPAGGVDAVGIAAQILYMHKLLTEELHVDVDFLQVGKFKGAEEPLTRDGPSPEARASLEGTLAELRRAWLDGIKAGKGKELAVEDGPYAPTLAKTLGLVDEVGYEDDAREAAKKEGAAVREVVRFGPGAVSGDADDVGDLLRAFSGPSASPPVVLVRAIGEISMGGGGGMLGGGDSGITEAGLSRELARIEKDDATKAVVLRIDSPGGSALASDLLWHDLMRLRAKKKLVVSVGGMAASGGYYLASTADVIFADRESIVGSIGVVGGKIAVGDALERFGVHAETFAADSQNPGARARAAYESPLVAWDEPTKARVYDSMKGIYDLFLARVAEGRKLPVEKIAASAEGRIFGGAEGKERGLVDELGGLSSAIARARALAGLPDDAKVGVVVARGRFADVLGGGDDTESKSPIAQQLARGEASAWLERAAPSATTFAASMSPLLDGEHAVCALPFALDVK